MTTILIRTVLMYLLLTVVLRLTGKRQIGQLEISDLVTTLLISEIASLPIEDPEIPILYAVVPIVTLLFFEVGLSALLLKMPALRGLFSHPVCLVRNGIPCEKELRASRISLEELLSALRQKDAWELRDVSYAFLEQNGQISVKKTPTAEPPSARDLGVRLEDTGISHILIADGKIRRHALKSFPSALRTVRNTLKKERCKRKEVLLMLMNDKGEISILRKEGRRKP